MICKEVKSHLSAYQDGEVDVSLGRLIEDHLKVCQDCQQEWQHLQQVVQQVGEMKEFEVPTQFAAAVMGNIKSKYKKKPFALPVWIYSLVFILTFALGIMIDDVAGNFEKNSQEKTITHLLLESQNLSLINVQDPTLEIVADSGSNPHGR